MSGDAEMTTIDGVPVDGDRENTLGRMMAVLIRPGFTAAHHEEYRLDLDRFEFGVVTAVGSRCGTFMPGEIVLIDVTDGEILDGRGSADDHRYTVERFGHDDVAAWACSERVAQMGRGL